jgi:hypothetical protein
MVIIYLMGGLMTGRIIVGGVVLYLSVLGAAMGAEIANQAALGHAAIAGGKQAQSWNDHHQLVWLLGGRVVVGGVILVATGNGHDAVGPTCPLPGCVPRTPATTTTNLAQNQIN